MFLNLLPKLMTEKNLQHNIDFIKCGQVQKAPTIHEVIAILRCTIINIPGAGISNIIIDIMLISRIEY